MILRKLVLRTHSESWRLLQKTGQRRLLSYSDNVGNLRINAETKVIFQGFTGRQATFDAKQSLEYGTKIVGGVRPGKDGEHLGLPVLPSVKAAVKHLKPDATAVYVAASGAAGAIEEAIEAEVPLIVAVAEFIPLHDMLRVQDMLRTQGKSRLVGPNCPGMINPHAKCRIGFPPIPFFQPGSVGIVSKSGTLSYETVASTTRAGVGQSLVIGLGGDPLPGTDFVDVLRIFESDENTKGIIIVGEIGGEAEQRVADWILEYKRRAYSPKPIMALVAGLTAPVGRIMGHAGAVIRNEQREAATEKIQRFEEAGVVLTDHPEKFGHTMKGLLSKSHLASSTFKQDKTTFNLQRRGIHSTTHSSRLLCGISKLQAQRRHFRVPLNTFKPGPGFQESPLKDTQFRLHIYIDRSTYKPMIVVQETKSKTAPSEIKLELNYGVSSTKFKKDFEARLRRARDKSAGKWLSSWGVFKDGQATGKLAVKANRASRYFKEKEASSLIFDAAYNAALKDWCFNLVDLEFDDSAHKSSQRQEEVYEHRDVSLEIPAAIEAEKYGIVYVRLPGEGNIGTLVNGAGLAMNTVDALTNLGGSPTNFLDTGGKATSETVSQSFRTILTDSRAKAIFVNIFGGLTLGDMIARGVLQAYKEVKIDVPVVVRLRGTNEKEGQKLIADSGLPIEAFDDFEEAARRVIDLANKATS